MGQATGRPVTTLNRWEKIASKTWSVNSTSRFTKSADLDPGRVLRSLLINVQGACTVGVADATADLADNVGAIVEQIRMFGSHQGRGSTDNFLQIRGCDLKELCNIRAGVKVFDNSSTIAVTHSATAYQFDFNILIDFPPTGHRVEEQVGYLLDVPNWSQLELDVQFGDANSIWNPAGTTTFTWASQTINLLGRYAQEKKKFAGFGFGLKYLVETENATAQLTTTASQVNLYQLDNKGKIRSLLLKTGTKASTVTSPNNAYATLSDAILANIRLVQVPSQKFREYARFSDLKAIDSLVYRYSPATGYALLDLGGDGLSFEALSPSSISTGEAGTTNLWLQADVTGAASQALAVAQESLYYSGNIVIPTS
jgi:hypothetical protein